MRIGLFTDTYPPYVNGVSTSIETLKKALESKGHIVYLLTLKYIYYSFSFFHCVIVGNFCSAFGTVIGKAMP